MPGTTRDIIREEISIDGILFKLYDTAGMRTSEDLIEKEGIRRSNDAVKNSDLVLLISDVEKGFDNELYLDLLQITSKDRIIQVLNKIDLAGESEMSDGIQISATTGLGINTLINAMKQYALGNTSYSEKSALVSNIRHYHCLESAKSSLLKVIESVNQKLSEEFISVDLRNAIDHLSEIIGEVTSEDVLNNIFSKFCIGK
jgi:tRNA modification GTPase